MTYQTFIDETIGILSPAFSTDTDISTEIIKKNNGLTPRALIIKEPDTNIFPTIYLDDYYNRAKAGETIDSIGEEILNVYKTHKIDGPLDIACLKDYQRIKKRICLRLVNMEKNRELLEEIPWKPFLDLALIPCICFDTPDEIYAGSVIHLSHLKDWKIDERELLEYAENNSPKILPFVLHSLPEFLNNIVGDVIIDTEKIDSHMYVLTNDVRTHGASALTYPEVLSDFVKKHDTDIFILPSSIHEVMLLPDDGKMTMENLNDLVKEVNRDHVSDAEYLSDHAYLYKKDTGEILY